MTDKINKLPELIIISENSDEGVHIIKRQFHWEGFEVTVTTNHEVTCDSPQTYWEPAEYEINDIGRITNITLKPFDGDAIYNLLSCKYETLLIPIIQDLFYGFDMDDIEPEILDDEKVNLKWKQKQLLSDVVRLEREIKQLKKEVAA